MRNPMISLLIFLTFALANPAKADVNWGNLAIEVFESVGANPSYIKERTKDYSLDGWMAASVAEVTAAGTAVCAIPIAHVPALIAEFPYYLREVYNSSLGVGAIIYGPISQDDFEALMYVWAGGNLPSAGQMEYIAEMSAWAAATFGATALTMPLSAISEKFSIAESTGKQGVLAKIADATTDYVKLEVSKKLASKFVAQEIGVKAGAKFASKIAAKVAYKISAKYGAKIASGFWPIVGAGICGAANGGLMYSILDASREYYLHKRTAILSLN